MGKNCLSFLGLIFLVILVLVGVGLMAYTYQSLGLVSIPKEWLPSGFNFHLPELSDLPLPTPEFKPTIKVNPGVLEAQWSNPLVALPTPTDIPTLEPTPTQIPPLSPEVYRAETMARMKDFAAAMERWVNANDRLSRDNTLIDDLNWRSEVKVDLESITMTAQALGNVGPAPAEYQGIDTWIKRVPSDAAALQTSYLAALDARSPESFLISGDHFKRIKDDLAQAVQEMIAQGWTFE